MTYDCPNVSTASPALAQSCTPPVSCTADTWNCTSWSTCAANATQTRTCTLINDCPSVPNTKPTESQSCEVEPGSLSVSVTSSPVSQLYIKGAQGASLVGISLRADIGNVTVSSIKFTGYIDAAGASGHPTTQGCDTNGAEAKSISDILSSTSLWNGSTQVGTNENPSSSPAGCSANSGGEIVFDNLDLKIAKSTTVTLVLKVNFANSAVNLPDAIAFDVKANSDISATNVLGSVTPSGAPVVGPGQMIMSGGSLGVTLAPSDTESEAGLLVGGASNAVLGKFKWTAQYEEMKVTKATFQVTGSSGVASLSLYDGSTLVAGPASVNSANGHADFSGVNFVIPKDGNKILTIKGIMSAVGGGGASAGTDVTVQLLPDNFEARGTGAGSSTVLTGANVAGSGLPLAGNTKRLVKSKPTVSLVALPTAVLSAGDQVIQRFTVAADAAGDIALGQVALQIAKEGAVALAKASGGDVATIKRIAGDFLPATVALAGGPTQYTLTIKLTNGETVAAGMARAYDVYLNLSGAVSSDSVSSNLLTDAAEMTGTFANVTAANNFVWSDLSADGHSFGTSDWASSWKVRNLPTDSQMLSK